MTLPDLIAKLQALKPAVEKAVQAAPLVACKEVEAIFQTRVFTKGQAASGAKIGVYSEKPFYAEQAQFAKPSVFRARGKGKRKKSGKPNTTMYMPGGYKQFRAVNGRQNAFVDLNLTGSLSASIKPVQMNGGWALVIPSGLEAQKAIENEKRFGQSIFKLSVAEQDKGIEIMKREILKAFKI